MAFDQEQIILAGHSHLAALGGSFYAAGAAAVLRPHPSDPRFVVAAGEWPRTPAYWAELRKAVDGRRIALSWDGNQHQAMFMFEPVPPIDFVLSVKTDDRVRSDAVLVPEALLREKFKASFNALRDVLSHLHGLDVLVLGTPPPRGDGDRIRTLLGEEDFFVSMAKGMNMELSVVNLSSRAFLLKVWRLLQDMSEKAAGDFGVAFLPVPDQVCDQGGFLKTDYVEDLTHANEAYGVVVRNQIAALLQPINSAIRGEAGAAPL